MTDVGLTWVTSKWDIPDALSRRTRSGTLPDGGPAAWWLTLPQAAVEEFDRTRARRLGQDVRVLVESPLPDAVLRTVWLGAVHGGFDPRAHGYGARGRLRALEAAWLDRVRRDDPAFPPPPPEPVADAEARQAVLRAIGPVADAPWTARRRIRRTGPR